MPVIFIPAPLRDLTQGLPSVQVQGATVREAIEYLEALFPGIQAGLCEAGRLRPTISVLVDGQITPLKLRERLSENSEVHFVIAISGG